MANIKTNQKEAKEKLMSFLSEAKFDVQQEISICLSDLPRTHMKKVNNGKIYMNLTIGMRKEPDQWGRDLKVYVTPSADDKKNKSPKIYVGGGKTFIFAENSENIPSESEVNNVIPPATTDEKDDLPF